MDGLLQHDGFEPYYAGKKKPREDEIREDAASRQLKREWLAASSAERRSTPKIFLDEAASR